VLYILPDDGLQICPKQVELIEEINRGKIVHQVGFLHTDKTKSVYTFIVAHFNWLHQTLEVLLFVTHNANTTVWYKLVQSALTFSVFVFFFSFSYRRDCLLYLLLFRGSSLPALFIFN